MALAYVAELWQVCHPGSSAAVKCVADDGAAADGARSLAAAALSPLRRVSLVPLIAINFIGPPMLPGRLRTTPPAAGRQVL